MRKFGIFGMAATAILGVVGVFSSLQELWAVSLLLVYAMLILLALMVVISARYQARLTRTEARKSRTSVSRIVGLLETIDGTNNLRARELHRLLEVTHDTATGAIDSVEAMIRDVQARLSEVESQMQKSLRLNKQHVSSAVRHSTNEVEALLQIFSRYPKLNPPMPSTGGWAIDAQALAQLVSLVEERRPQRILELGSGTSTIWLGHVCRSYGGSLIALDHLEDYFDQTRKGVARHGLADYVEVRLAPLEGVVYDGVEYLWYSADAINNLSEIDMLIVDGPPAATGRKARYPALPQIIDQLSRQVTVVLDDAHREDEAEIIDSWCAQFPEFTRLDVGVRGLAVLERGY